MRWIDILLSESSTPRVLRTVPGVEAVEMLHTAYYGGKNKEMGLTPTRFHRPENEDFVLVDLPLGMILPNQEDERYDATANLDRVRTYAKQQITTPIFVTYSKHAMRMGSRLGYVSDGGHRVSAARLRGDTYIRALMRHGDFDRLVAVQSLTEAEATHRVIMFHGGKDQIMNEIHGMLSESVQPQHGIWWHGSASGDLRGGRSGLHVGTKKAATEALEARIGIPADGRGWTGDREWGKTLLAGKRTMTRMGIYPTGYNTYAPNDDYYPTNPIKYPDGSTMPMTVRPDVRPYRIIGPMTNGTHSPYDDFKANGYMAAQIKRYGRGKRGYYYKNVGEDAGSISAVVPDGGHLERAALTEARLAKPNCDGPCLYHATFAKRVPSIMQYGLGHDLKTRNYDISRKIVYLTDHPDVAAEYAQEAAGDRGIVDDIVVLLVDQDQLDPALLHKDSNDTGGMLSYQGGGDYRSYEYRGVIPPSSLSISHTL